MTLDIPVFLTSLFFLFRRGNKPYAGVEELLQDLLDEGENEPSEQPRLTAPTGDLMANAEEQPGPCGSGTMQQLSQGHNRPSA